MGITRGELFARLGLIQEVETLTEQAYRFGHEQQAGQSDQGAAVSDLWHLSFHGSQFPGDAERACPRQLLYRMMDIPRATGSHLFSNRRLEQISDAGKDIEDRLVMKWYRAGYLWSPPPYDCFGNPQQQMVFEDPSIWLTSTVDSILVKPRSVMPIVSEVKSKYAEVIADMHKLIRRADEKHVRQLKTQIAMARAWFIEHPQTVERCFNTGRMAIDFPKALEIDGVMQTEKLCPQHFTRECLREVQLKPPERGVLYYVSRDDPIDTHEFYYEYDPDFYEAGKKVLEETRDAFMAGVLPQTNFEDKRFAHPFGWKWGEEPCKWCDYGDSCRADRRLAIERGEPIALGESDAVLDAKAIKADYDLDLVRAAVFQRWGVNTEQAAA